MTATETEIKGVFIIEPTLFQDNRGYFFESFNQREFERITRQKIEFVQDNQAFSNYGVIRGLHYQIKPHAQSKLVRVITGKVLDVVVDMRKDSPTFLKSFSIELSGRNRKQLFIPKGLAHGYSVLADDTIFSYKCDSFYYHTMEAGINCRDTRLNINWRIPKENQIVSKKDLELPFLTDLGL